MKLKHAQEWKLYIKYAGVEHKAKFKLYDNFFGPDFFYLVRMFINKTEEKYALCFKFHVYN